MIDVNQVMNSLLNKIADAITAPSTETTKKLVEIRDILLELKRVEKTTPYILTEDTIKKVNKTLSLVELPDEKALKEMGIETPGPNKTFKLDESQLPQTEGEARLKFNQLIDTNIESTVKAINEVIEITNVENKVLNQLPEGERTSKILTEILLSLLATSLKTARDLEFPAEPIDKEISEINLDLLLRRRPGKSEQEIEKAPEIIRKTAFGIGQFPSVLNKNAEDVSIVTTRDSKLLDNVPFSSEGENKLNFDTDFLTPGTESIKVSQNLNILDVTTTKAQEPLPEAVNPIPVGVDVPTPENIARSKSELGDTTPMTIPAVPAKKPGSPNEWYGNWGYLFGNKNNPNNSIASGNLSVFGVNAGDVNAFTNKNFGKTLFGGNLQRSIGQTLSFFGITSGDVGRYINKGQRFLNTVANAFALTLAIQRIQAGLDRRKSETRVLNENRIYSLITAAVDNRDEKIERTQEDLPLEQQQWLNDSIFLRGKSQYGNVNRTYLVGGGRYEVDDTTLEAPQKISVEDRYFSVSAGLVKKAPGFLKIYTKRGPKFESSKEESFIIPFQSEPAVSGDSKAAEYATISTLARSQSAQVYRRSNERNVSLQLDYVVIQPPDLYEKDVNESRSDSVKNMAGWTEDYVYNYIVRNLKNLVLPNIIGPRYKLAPPIVQVWYGGLGSTSASSTGDGLVDNNNEMMLDVFPTFRTNWFDSSGQQKSYRSLWVCRNIAFEYKGGYVSSDSRNRVWVTASVDLIEIAPSVTDNEVLLWRKLAV